MKNDDSKADYEGVKSHYSTYAEYGVSLFEVFLLISFAIPVWKSLKTEFPEVTKDTVEIRVIAQQFAWNIHYPGADGKFGNTSIYLVDEMDNPIGLDRDSEFGADDIVTNNQLNIPVGKDIMIYLSSKDVIHSFSLPEMRVKQDAIPGMTVPVFFKATLTSEDFLELITSSRSQIAKEIADKKREIKSLELRLKDLSEEDHLEYEETSKRIEISKDEIFNIEKEKSELLTQRYQPDTYYGLDQELWRNMMDDKQKDQYRGYQISCAQLCGNSHYKMRGFMTVQTEEEFQAWLDENKPEEEDDDW